MLAAELQGLLEQHARLEATVDLLEVRKMHILVRVHFVLDEPSCSSCVQYTVSCNATLLNHCLASLLVSLFTFLLHDEPQVRDDPTVVVLLRDCAEATKAARETASSSSSSQGSGGSLQEVQAASALVATAEETVRRVAEANGEKATFEGVVVPMVAALRRRITLVHQSASPAAAAVRSASSSGFPQAAQEADSAVSGVEALLHQV